MKYIVFTLVLNLLFLISFAQNEDDKSSEFQFNLRTEFARVDDRYNILFDTLFYANSGFRVYSDYDIDTASNGTEYVIFRYPKWRKTVGEYSKEDSLMGNSNVTSNLENKSLRQYFSYNSPSPDSLSWDRILRLYSKVFDTSDDYSKAIEGFRDLGNEGVSHCTSDTNSTTSEKLQYASYPIRKKGVSLYGTINNTVEQKPLRKEIYGINNRKIAMPKEDFERLRSEGEIINIYSLKWRYSTKMASGFMTVPFKLRPKIDTVNFNMTTDITLGPYIGVKKRISRKGNNFLVFPLTLGLSYINVGNDETSNVNTENNSSIVPGWSWSLGTVFDLDGFNIGFVFGQDFASGVGENWLYNKKIWYSFSIGYSFFSKKD